MARIARSTDPLYQTRERPVSWPVTVTGPDESVLDLTGCAAAAVLRWNGAARRLTVSPFDAGGRCTVTGGSGTAADMPLGPGSELVFTLTDSQGGITDYVWPVIGEVP